MQSYPEINAGNDRLTEKQLCDPVEAELSSVLQGDDFPCRPEISVNDLRNRQIIVYGAGNGFITLSAFVISRYHLTVSMILDQQFHAGESWRGIVCGSLEDFCRERVDWHHSVVILSIGDEEIRMTVTEKLKALGFPWIIAAMDIYEYHLPFLPEEQKNGLDFNFFRSRKKEISAALQLFSEDKSRQVFAGFMKTHLLRKRYAVPSEPASEQYFPPDLPFPEKVYMRAICCGAYNGDTAMKISDYCPAIQALACFEPDPQNFDMMLKNLSFCHSRIRELLFFPCGVHAQEKQFLFTTENRMNSAISATGDTLIQCVSLDHVLPLFQPTFISMDIEGAEMEALHGCTEILRRSHPDLAVCVYHTPNHIWEIPLFLNALHLGYRFALRNYSSYSAETVLYAY